MRYTLLALLLLLGVCGSAAAQVPSTYAHQTNVSAAATDDHPPSRYCHVTNVPGAADDHPPSSYCHETNSAASGNADDHPPSSYVYFTNLLNAPDSPPPAIYVHVTNWVNTSGSGCSVNLLLEFNAPCNAIAVPLLLR